jgi:hypothetical protein
MKIFLFISILIGLFFSSFTYNKGYKLENQKHFHFEPTYSKNDTLIISDYIIYGNTKPCVPCELNNYLKIKTDSLFSILKNVLLETKLPLKFQKTNANLVRYEIEKNINLKFKRIYFTEIIPSTQIFENKSVLFPIISLVYDSYTTGDFETKPRHFCYFRIAVFVFKNGKLTYYKQVRHNERVDAKTFKYQITDRNFNIPIPQQHWDGMVQEVMREYFNRLK